LDVSIGIDVGGTKVLGGAVDKNGVIQKKVRRDTPKSGGEALNQVIAEVIEELLHEFPSNFIGISAAGLVSSDRRTMLGAPNIANWDGVDIAGAIDKLIGIKVIVENDANAAAWAEAYHGAGRGEKNVLILTVGTGLGGAVVINGELYRGSHGTAAEFGHVRVVPDGHLCGCGVNGCFEQYSSGTSLMRRAKAAIEKDPHAARSLLALGDGTVTELTGAHITKAAISGDALAIKILGETGDWLGMGIATLAMVFDPALVIIGGGVVEAGELLLGPARIAMERVMPFAGKHPSPRIVAAKLENDAGLIGVADLARR
jgi:glucokinase